MDILIKDVLLYDKVVDICINKNKFSKIGPNLKIKAKKVINAKNKAIFPGLMNAHTHAAMTLFRGYADDIELQKWLEEYIWPLESKLTAEQVYWGTRLGILEMIKSGTTFFNDMYWQLESIVEAVKDSGIRSALSGVIVDLNNSDISKGEIKRNENLYKKYKNYSDRIQFCLGPHAVYSVSENSLKWVRKFANKHNLIIHIHAAESSKEVKDCLKRTGFRSIEYLNNIGFLGKNIIFAHPLWVNEKEIKLIKKYNSSIVMSPVSNMKLANNKIVDYRAIQKEKINTIIGTDGAASNNNLNMLETMKIGCLVQKLFNKPTTLPATEMLDIATKNCAKAFKIKTGEIKEDYLADCFLVNLDNINFIPNHNTISNLIYSANPCSVDTTICNGEILMQNRKVKDEKKIISNARRVMKKLFNK
jgi:5-methylthioadenosine/S-adenosylhomocysteine deaminase